MNVEALQFEIKKRQLKSLSLRSEINQERVQAQRIEDMEYPRLTKPEDMLDSGPTWSYICRLEEELKGLGAEITAIEKILSERYGSTRK